jgi:hypothetical protein
MTCPDAIPCAPPDALPDSLRELAAAVVEAHERMAAAWESIVHEHIATGCTDVNAMEWTLDHLLSCACHPQGLDLYRQLCRYLGSIDPQAAASAVDAYREMWDPDEQRPWAAASRAVRQTS